MQSIRTGINLSRRNFSSRESQENKEKDVENEDEEDFSEAKRVTEIFEHEDYKEVKEGEDVEELRLTVLRNFACPFAAETTCRFEETPTTCTFVHRATAPISESALLTIPDNVCIYHLLGRCSTMETSAGSSGRKQHPPLWEAQVQTAPSRLHLGNSPSPDDPPRPGALWAAVRTGHCRVLQRWERRRKSSPKIGDKEAARFDEEESRRREPGRRRPLHLWHLSGASAFQSPQGAPAVCSARELRPCLLRSLYARLPSKRKAGNLQWR